MTDKEKIKLLVRQFGGTQEAFAKRIGATRDAVRSWVQHDAIPGKGVRKILEHCPGVSAEWLMGGGEDITGSGSGIKHSAPLFTNIAATCGESEQPQELHEQSVPFAVPGVDADAFIPVAGFSMKPTINEGDIIGIKRVESVNDLETAQTSDRGKPSPIYLIITQDNERLVKRISSLDDATLTLCSDNPAFLPFKISKASILSIHRVVWHGSAI